MIPQPRLPQGLQPPVVALLDTSTAFERRLLMEWLDRQRASAETIAITSSRRRRAPRTEALTTRAAAGDNPTFLPLRVVWLSPERGGRRSFRVSDFLRFGDIRDPDPVRARWLHARHPELTRIVAGAPGTAAELRLRWAASGDHLPLGVFIERQAHLALDRAERQVRGARYKVPRFIDDEVLAQPGLRAQIVRLAEETGQAAALLRRRAARYLREIAARPNTYVIDVVAGLVHWLYRRGYRDLHYEEGSFGELTRLASERPVAYLPAHQSNLDHLVLSHALWENGLPPNHTAGGVNMSFFPVGPIIRRTGVFFIRRSFRDNDLYKVTLRSYLDYLIEKRFPLEWYLEGGRSRTGKLRPPRYGMLSYVADSVRRGRSEDLYLIPVAIAYDQIHEVGAHAAEQRGETKEVETAGWLVRAVRSLQGRFGSIYLRFGEPISLAEELASESPDRPLPTQAIQKLAFEVMVRIQRVTPITEPAVVVSALLSNGGLARSHGELLSDVSELERYIAARSLPVAPHFDPVRRLDSILDLLEGRSITQAFGEGPETVYGIDPRRYHEAAYYRNTIVHHFVAAAIAELALLAAAEEGREATLWEEVRKWRDLLKFEFFFPERTAFREEVRSELMLMDPRWQQVVQEGREAAERLLARVVPVRAHWVLRPWIDGYLIAAQELLSDGPTEVDLDSFTRRCLSRGAQYLRQGRIASPESVSKVVFESALQLAANQGLLEGDPDELADRRRAFARLVSEAQQRIRVVGEIARRQRAGF